jgi:hypothetical protein
MPLAEDHGHWYAGMWNDHTGDVLKRVKGYIERYNMYKIEASTAWVMLSYGSKYAQIGFERGIFSSVHMFVQVNDSGGMDTWDLGAMGSPGSGGVHDLFEVRTNRLGHWEYWLNGSQVTGANFDRTDTWAPDLTTVSAEVLNQPIGTPAEEGDQITGDAGEMTGFKEIKVYVNGAYAYEDFYDNGYQINPGVKPWFAINRAPYLINGKIWEFDTYDERCPN